MSSGGGSDSYGNENITLEELEKKAPEGEFVAYINSKEAKMLKDAGGSGKLVNGIPSFTEDESDTGDVSNSGSSSSTSNSDGTDNEEADPSGADTGFGGSSDSDRDDDDGYGGGYTQAEAAAAGVDTSQDTSFSGGDGSDYDVGFDAGSAGFTPTQEDSTFGEQVTDFITGGGLIGAGIRTAQDLFGGTPNQYAGITGEDGYGEGDYTSTVADYAESRGLTTDYASEDLETQAAIDQQAFDEGFRSQSFKDIANTGDFNNLQNLNQAESDFAKQLIPQAPFLIGGGQAPKSMVNEYFSNLQNQPQTGGILDRYNVAKSNISGILGTNNQFGANNQVGASNTSNFYYNYLNQKGLL